MLLKLFIILICVIHASAVDCHSLVVGKIYTAEEIFECIDQLTIEENMKSMILDDVTEKMKSYIYKDIAKNPPLFGNRIKLQPVDIDQYIESLRNKQHDSFYDFLVDLNKLSVLLRDGHLSFMIHYDCFIYNKLKEITMRYPFNFHLENDTLYLVDDSFFFDKNNYVLDGREIESINGQNPLDYIMSLGLKISSYKNSHSVFSDALNYIRDNHKMNFPFIEKEYLKEEIYIKTYGNTSVNIGRFNFIYNPTIIQNNTNYNFTSNFKKLLHSSIKYVLGIYDVECFIDNKLKINTIIHRSFNDDLSGEYFKYCLGKFSVNKYPTQIIFAKNFGGVGTCSQESEAEITYNDDIDYFGDLICDQNSKEELTTKEFFTGVDDCLPLNKYFVDENMNWVDECREIKFGNVSHVTTHLIKLLNIIERNSTYRRKPTELFIYTDSLCFSACSTFTKGIKEHGSGVIIGFMGHPNITGTEMFDVGSSPTSVLQKDICVDINNNTRCILTMSLSVFETYRFNYNYNETIPREYILDQIDERFYFYEFYSHDNYEHFANYTLSLYQKYKTKCNPNNKRLIFYEPECDNELSFIDPHLHGGYLCNDDGYWSNTCVGAYCDVGYKFDRDNMKCIKDPCNPIHKQHN